MTSARTNSDDREGMLRLSHRLVALHIGGLALLFFVVLSTVFWTSAEHNRLALASSERLVQSGVMGVRTRTYALVKDYSLWNEGYAAALDEDREWLYTNIGVGATDNDIFNLIVLLVPGGSGQFGWTESSPEEGERDILPEPLVQAILKLLDEPQHSTMTRTLLAGFQGEPWVFAVERLTPVDGMPEGVAPENLPVQIHGRKLGEDWLSTLGQSLLIPGLRLGTPKPGEARVALRDYADNLIGTIAWPPPRPGASILRKAAVPLTVALSVSTLIAVISSVYAVRSARRLEGALFAAKAADRSKSEFLSNVSHELRTPMNGVLGAAQLLDTSPLDGEQRELVNVLLTSAKAQMALITDLIDYSRVEAGRRRLEAQPFEPAKVLAEVTDMMQVAAARKRIRLETDWPELVGVSLRGDAQAFRQVVTNLVGNAVKFTESGGVTVRARLDPGDGQARVDVSVIDTGPGIPEEALPRIFDRFYQVDGSMSRTSEGTGLGLAISQRLAQMMGGGITVDSQPGEGSTFEFVSRFDNLDWPPEARDAA